MAALGHPWVATVRDLQQTLLTKDHKLANYLRMDLKNCNEAATTSPVESANKSLKFGPYAVHSNMNMDRATRRMIKGINKRLDRRRAVAHRKMNMSYLASRSHINDYVIKEGQGQIDYEFDRRLTMKSVQLTPELSVAWDFDSWINDMDANQDVGVLFICLYSFVSES